ncbi:hypothetical protein QQZ08_003393 [Neonectria magnoliae]|uniref:Uncharacterized protein n=1 Tax=Neonectria magnoliae TaxID=2732573 RepID=A0ABR1I9V3_9HYPO
MDINADNFWENLSTILLVLGSATYVAINVQLVDHAIKEELSLDEDASHFDHVYGRLRSATQKFAVTRLGITAVHWDSHKYTSHTYSIAINPLIANNTPQQQSLSSYLDRRLSLSPSSLQYLQGHGLNLSAAFGNGVPYLSRREFGLAKLRLAETTWPDTVDLNELSEKDSRFIEGLREKLRKWLAQDSPEALAEDTKAKKAAIAEQLGLLWIFEALIGGPRLEELVAFGIPSRLRHPRADVVASLGEVPERWQGGTINQQLAVIIRRVRRNRHIPMIVVHDGLVDLGFLYSLFVGPLPLIIDTFQNQIRKDLFSKLLETKWMLTGFGDFSVLNCDIDVAYEELEDQWFPSVDTVPGMGYTLCEEASVVDLANADLHEAGLASYMTAMVFLKTQCKRWQSYRWQMSRQPNFSLHHPRPLYNIGNVYLFSRMDRALRGEDISIPNFSEYWRDLLNRIHIGRLGVLHVDDDNEVTYSTPGDIEPWHPPEDEPSPPNTGTVSQSQRSPFYSTQPCEQFVEEVHTHADQLHMYAIMCQQAWLDEDEDLVRGRVRAMEHEVDEAQVRIAKYLETLAGESD